MADRYQDRAYSAGGDYDRDNRARASDNAESDPLAELARLIGQTDPFGAKPMSRANLQAQPQVRPADPEPGYDDDYADPEPYEAQPPAPPSWMQRAAVRQEAPPPPPQPQQDYYADEDDYPAEVHPLHRYSAPQPPTQHDYDPAQLFGDTHQQQPDMSRYDDALYGSLESDAQNAQHDHGYVDNAYAYEDDQQFDQVEEPRKRGGMITVFAVLALAVFGVGGAYAYRTFTGSARTGEPPIIRADAGPTKIIPAPGDAATKVPDRMTPSDGTEKIVSREEAPIDPNRSGPRVVFPPLTSNGTAPMPTSVFPPGVSPPAPNGANGTFSNNDPRKIKTFSVRGDQGDAGAPAAAAPAAAPAAKGAAAAQRAAAPNARTATNPAAANANAPLSLAPQSDAPAAAEPPVRMAATTPTQQVAPSAPASSGGGGFLVSVTSQPSEAEAQASYRALQSKYPSVLGSQSAVVARASSKSGAATYRAGPAFGTSAEAAQFCKSYQGAGGQCWVVKN